MRSTAVHNVLQHALARYGGVRVQEFTGEVIPFEFTNENDMYDALDLNPWAIQGNCLYFKKWSKESRISEVQFHILQFLVQIHGLEVNKFSCQNALKLGECIAVVKEVDESIGPMGLDRDYMRVKVEVNSNYPLLARIWYTRMNGEMGRVEIRYGRLPDFYFG